jgi:two-component system, OmpR family, KDP operon response regulator KdpE
MTVESQDTTLLVVDDDTKVREFVGLTLRLGGYQVLFADDGEGVPEMVIRQRPRMVVMDISMPVVTGIDALRRLRSLGSDVPVIMLTARGSDEDKLAAFDAGADDYLVKPFSARELVARVGAVLRRARLSLDGPEADTVVYVGPLILVPGNHTATINDRDVSLTRTEYALLLLLARAPERVFTPAELLGKVWGPEYRDQAEILRTNIYRLRQKLEEDPKQPRYLRTRTGVGYYFSPD